MDRRKASSPCHQPLGKRSILGIGRREYKKEGKPEPRHLRVCTRKPRTRRRGWGAGACPQGVAGSWRLQTRIEARSMMRSRAPMRRDWSTCATGRTKRDSCRGTPAAGRRLRWRDVPGMRGGPGVFRGNPYARANADQRLSQSRLA
jgi:hypothetical protein